MALSPNNTLEYTPIDLKQFISFNGNILTPSTTLETRRGKTNDYSELPNFVERNIVGKISLNLDEPENILIFPAKRISIFDNSALDLIYDNTFNYFNVTKPAALAVIPQSVTVNSDETIDVVTIILPPRDGIFNGEYYSTETTNWVWFGGKWYPEVPPNSTPPPYYTSLIQYTYAGYPIPNVGTIFTENTDTWILSNISNNYEGAFWINIDLQ